LSKRTEPIRSVKGTRDLLPRETALWQRVEEEARRVFAVYNYREIRTPILEETELFARSVGDDTDIVQKEMYTFEDKYFERPSVPSRDWIDELERALEEGKIPPIRHNIFVVSELKEGFKRWNEYIEKPSSQKTEESEREFDRLTLYLGVLGRSYLTLNMVSLRPEATASVVRAYIEHGLYNEGGIHKLYYMGAMFRRERPQKGRYRQFYQIGAEVLGTDHPAIDAEVLEMLTVFLECVGIGQYALLVNSVGCPKCRREYVKVLRQALERVKTTLCADCQRRVNTNPLRVLDCKVEADQPVIEKLPKILDHLCPECRQHFESVTAELKERGIPHQISPRLVRGLDYYTRTTFEITSDVLGAQNALLGGGRYDGLSELIGGPPTPGFGFAIGQDRLHLAVEAAGRLKCHAALAAYIAWMGDSTLAPASRLARELRREGLSVEIGYEPVKLKKSLGAANKLGARFAIIVGEGELASGRFQVKNMETGQQEEVEPGRIATYIRDRLQGKNT